jgi:hypothetical protein
MSEKYEDDAKDFMQLFYPHTEVIFLDASIPQRLAQFARWLDELAWRKGYKDLGMNE